MATDKLPVILVGSGGHAKVVLDIIELSPQYRILGVTTNDPHMTSFCGYPVLGQDDVLPKYFQDGIKHVAIGVGGFVDNKLRREVFLKIISLGFHAVTLIHPSAVLARDVQVGDGSVIFAGVVINPGVSIGKNSIIATGSTVDHETMIADHVLVSAGVSIGASVTVEEGALLAIGSVVVSGKTIGRGSLVSAGAVVVKDVDPQVTVVGIPARQKSERK